MEFYNAINLSPSSSLINIVGIYTLSPLPSSPITIYEISSPTSLSIIITNLAPAAAAFIDFSVKWQSPLLTNMKGKSPVASP